MSSAARVEETGTTLSITDWYRATAASRHAGVVPPTTFGIVRVENFGFPGSSRSGENARKKSRPTCIPPGREAREEAFIRRPGISRALEDDELARPEDARDRFGRLVDVAKVWLPVVVERRRDADDDRVGFGEPVEVGRGGERLGRTGSARRRQSPP